MKKFKVIVLVCALLCFVVAPSVEAKGGKGGGGGRSSGSKSAVAKPAQNDTAGTTQSAKPKPPSTKPSKDTAKVDAGKEVTSANGKKMKSQGNVVGENYQPKFSGGYTPPPGSVVYYRQNSFLDYLPWIFLFTMDSHKEVVVQTPDGKEETHKEEGIDTMYVINWIVSILLVFGLIALIMALINRSGRNDRNNRNNFRYA